MDIKPIVKPDFVFLQESASVSEMIGALKNLEKRSALIFRNKKYIGLVEKKKLLRTRIDTTEAKVGGYIHHTPILSLNTNVVDAASLLFESAGDILPVEKDKTIIGIVEGVDIAVLAAEMPGIKKLRVSDLKILLPPQIDQNAPVAAAIDAMHDLGLDLLPILEKGKVCGILSYRDLLRKYLNWSPKRDVSAKFNKMASTRSAETDFPHLASLPVNNFIGSADLVTVKSKDNILKVLDQMLKNKVSGLVVLDGDTYKGILPVRSLLKAIADSKEVQNFTVSYIGLSKLNLQPHQLESISRIVSTEAPKLERQINNKFNLAIHIKSYDKTGKKQKFSVHMRVEHPGKLVTCSDDDWRIEDALHQVFEHAENALRGRFHSDSSQRKYRE